MLIRSQRFFLCKTQEKEKGEEICEKKLLEIENKIIKEEP
jgi:hypothetical protein